VKETHLFVYICGHTFSSLFPRVIQVGNTFIHLC